MIYLIGGMSGMRKTTIMARSVLIQRPMDHNSTDVIRVSTSQLYRQLSGKDPMEIQSLKPLMIAGESLPAWIGTIGLILFWQNQDALIEGEAIRPAGVAELLKEFPTLPIKAAFIGYSKKMEFQEQAWTPNLERLIEKAGGIGGKQFLEDCKKRYAAGRFLYRKQNGMPGLDPFVGDEESRRQQDDMNKLVDPKRFKFFDVIDDIPAERRGGERATLQLEDQFQVAIRVISFLLNDSQTPNN